MNYPIPNKTVLFVALFSSSSLYAKTADKEPNTKAEYYCVANNNSITEHLSKNNNKLTNPVQDAIYLEADTGKIIANGTSSLHGNVIIQQNATIFTANNAQINRLNNQVTADGNVELSNNSFSLKSPKVDYNLDTKTGTVLNAEYILGIEGVRGNSTQIKLLDKDRLHLEGATFTSCPIDKESWHLSSENISLDNETQTGTAKNVTLNIGKIPVFYFPWLKFPTNNQRASGFLTPRIRPQTNEGITIPYYLNLAPNYDALLELTTINNRGIQLATEFRYLTKKHEGEIEYSFIPRDEAFDNELRDYFKIEHRSEIDDSITFNLNAEGVSDKEYFDDFSSSLETSASTSLQRRLEIQKNSNPWLISAAIEDYQTISSDEDPYSRLPELKLNYAPKTGPKDLKLEVNSELVYFTRNNNDPEGTRADIELKLSKKWGNQAWYFKPDLSLEHTIYSLNNNTDNDISRTLPTVTLDGGLFFDREITSNQINKKTYTQTLEPRLFYTHTPFKDQSNIPNFDTSTIDFSESNQLFLEDRFTGKDRVADTNQLTFALSSRIQDRENGDEIFKATLGQIFFFSDRKVTLPDGTISTSDNSDLLLELSGRLNERFRLASTINLDSVDKEISSYDLRLNYQDDKKRIANLSFRKLDEELEQISFSTAFPVTDKWSIVASSDHDTLNDRNLESLIGLEYQDCCWKTRVVAKRFLTSDNISYDTPVFIEFELKGLGNIGKSATRQIEEKIYGYDDF